MTCAPLVIISIVKATSPSLTRAETEKVCRATGLAFNSNIHAKVYKIPKHIGTYIKP